MHPTVGEIYTDFQGLAELKARTGKDQAGNLGEVARQFESLLLHMMLKSMRQASAYEDEGLMDSDQTRFYRDMYDQQLAVHLAEGGGLGLADVIERQLGGKKAEGGQPERSLEDYRLRAVGAADAKVVREQPIGIDERENPVRMGKAGGRDHGAWSVQDFVAKLWPWAREAANKLGLTPQALLAQAALETGWGKHLPRFGDGSSSFNLFGIKADDRWSGKKLGVDTLEFEQDVVVRKRAIFRAYDSFRDSFSDYVQFLQSNPRYREVLASTGSEREYFSALQQAGYATDPNYADKINGVLNGPPMVRALETLKAGGIQPL